ncbi:TetR/AcrR family transcriptional regulator [Demequina rhizosphaerae]|uniref:TetR/AcrR family transcriptional regulator n=1 Tax=Demequina rhizosphaerae TaxID=1638985 RepID=UPI0009E56387|nr:TetR/AcrR family transcriptional regulator [Demequina rhizosphaerae]
MASRRGPYRVGQRWRARIVEVAARELATAGYDGLVLAEVADKAGLSASALQHYFPTRRHLLAAVAEQRLAAIGETWPRADDVQDVHELFENAAAAIATMSREPGLVELAVRVATDAIDPESPAHEWARTQYASVVESNAATFAACAARGELRDGVDPELASRALQAVADGLQLQWAVSGRAIDLAATSARAISELARATIAPAHLDEARLARLAAGRSAEQPA